MPEGTVVVVVEVSVFVVVVVVVVVVVGIGVDCAAVVLMSGVRDDDVAEMVLGVTDVGDCVELPGNGHPLALQQQNRCTLDPVAEHWVVAVDGPFSKHVPFLNDGA